MTLEEMVREVAGTDDGRPYTKAEIAGVVSGARWDADHGAWMVRLPGEIVAAPVAVEITRER